MSSGKALGIALIAAAVVLLWQHLIGSRPVAPVCVGSSCRLNATSGDVELESSSFTNAVEP